MLNDRTWAKSHNIVAELDTNVLPAEFTDMAHFLNATTLKYALTENPTIYASHVKQFWATATLKTHKGEQYIRAYVDAQKVLVSEDNIRHTLLFDDEEGSKGLVRDKLFEGLEALGYERRGTGLKFQKGFFSTKWKFLAHTLLHCFSPKTTGWNEVNAAIASAMICLSKGDPFNFSNMILEGFVSNVKGKTLTYPRFVQLLINDQIELNRTHKSIYECPKMGSVSFTFLAKANKDFTGQDKPLTPYMLALIENNQGEGSGTQTDSQHTPTFDEHHVSPHISPQKTYTRRKASKNTELPQTSVRMDIVPDGAVTGDGGDMLVRANTTASSLAAEQDSVNINKTQSKATSNVNDSHESNTGDGFPSHMENIGGSVDQTRFDTGLMSQDSPLREGHTSRSEEDRIETVELMANPNVQNVNVNDSPLGPGNTGRSDETSMQQIKELRDTCTNLETKCHNLEFKVTALETLTAAQGNLINTLKQQMEDLQKQFSSTNTAATLGEDASKQGRNSTVSGEEIGGIKIVAAQVVGDDGLVSNSAALKTAAMEIDNTADTTAVKESAAIVLEPSLDAGIIEGTVLASGEAKGDDDSGDNVNSYVVVDKNDHEAVLDKAIQVKDSTAQESTAGENSTAGSGSGDNSVAETLLMLQEKFPIELTSQPLQTIALSQPISLSQPIHVSKLPTKGVSIREPTPIIPKVKPVISSTDKGKQKIVEEDVSDSSDDEEEYKKLPQEFWPKDKLIDADRALAMELAMGDSDEAGVDEQARLLAEHEVLEALKSRRSGQGESKTTSDEFDYVLTPDEVEYLIKKNPEVHMKAIELTADVTLSPEQKTTQLHEFIRKIIVEASELMVGNYQGKQKKRKRKPTEAQLIKQMKLYLCAQCGWKMHQFKGMAHDAIRLHYYSGYKMNKMFIPMGSKEEENWKKSHDEHMAACRERAKKSKMEGSNSAGLTEQVDELHQKVADDRFLIEQDDVFIEPAQARQQIVDWEVAEDEFSAAWKIVRVGGEVEMYRDFEDLVRSCDRSDLHNLWSLVKSKNAHADPKNLKAMELWVCFQRMYNPDPSDRHWRFEAESMTTIWKHYNSCDVHHVSTQDGADVFMFVDKDYPLKTGVLKAMIEAKLRCSEVTPDLQSLVKRIEQQSTREVGRR